MRALRWLLWPGCLVIIVVVSLGINLVMVAASMDQRRARRAMVEVGTE